MSECWLGGFHAVEALLANPHRKTKKLCVSRERKDQRIQAIMAKAEALGIPIELWSLEQLNERLTDISHQGILALAEPIREFHEKEIPYLIETATQPPFLLLLDGVTDPHNLGACLRSADAAGVDFVLIPKDKSASITPVVSKVACGAAESVPLIRVTNLSRTMETLKSLGVWLYGAAGEATQSLYQMDLTAPVGIVMGAEGPGLRRLTREHCDALFSIPMVGTVESLNVSVATGISVFEGLRQRQTLAS